MFAYCRGNTFPQLIVSAKHILGFEFWGLGAAVYDYRDCRVARVVLIRFLGLMASPAFPSLPPAWHPVLCVPTTPLRHTSELFGSDTMTWAQSPYGLFGPLPHPAPLPAWCSVPESAEGGMSD